MSVVFVCAVLELFVVIKSLLSLSAPVAVMNIVLVLICIIYGTLTGRQIFTDENQKKLEKKSPVIYN